MTVPDTPPDEVTEVPAAEHLHRNGHVAGPVPHQVQHAGSGGRVGVHDPPSATVKADRTVWSVQVQMFPRMQTSAQACKFEEAQRLTPIKSPSRMVFIPIV